MTNTFCFLLRDYTWTKFVIRTHMYFCFICQLPLKMNKNLSRYGQNMIWNWIKLVHLFVWQSTNRRRTDIILKTSFLDLRGSQNGYIRLKLITDFSTHHLNFSIHEWSWTLLIFLYFYKHFLQNILKSI